MQLLRSQSTCFSGRRRDGQRESKGAADDGFDLACAQHGICQCSSGLVSSFPADGDCVDSFRPVTARHPDANPSTPGRNETRSLT